MVAVPSVQPVPGAAGRAGGQAPGFRDGERDHVDQLCEEWLELARGRGIPVHDKHGDLLPDVDDAITHTVSAAIWFGLTTGYLSLTGSYHIPRKFLP